MNSKSIITHALGFVLLFSMVACQKEEAEKRGPSPVLSTDTDLGHGYVRRDGAIHFIGGGTTGTGANATRIDTPSPRLLRKVVDSKFGPFKTAEGLDVASFEALSETYTRDENLVYYKVISNDEFIVIVLPEADPASFKVLSSRLAYDKNHVWLYQTIQPGADPATIELVDASRSVYKDKDSVHYQYTQIPGADSASFKNIGAAYYADRKRAYWCSTPIPDADLPTFEVMGDSFIAKDRSKLYRSGVHLPGYDVASFELILHNPAGFQIFSDKNGIHVNEMTFPRSKPGKVEIIDNKTVKAGDLIHMVNTQQYTPVTIFKEDGKLMAETLAYEPKSRKVVGMITAEVTADGLMNIRISPLPGGGKPPKVPDWQVKRLNAPHLLQWMIEAGNLIK